MNDASGAHTSVCWKRLSLMLIVAAPIAALVVLMDGRHRASAG